MILDRYHLEDKGSGCCALEAVAGGLLDLIQWVSARPYAGVAKVLVRVAQTWPSKQHLCVLNACSVLTRFMLSKPQS